MGIKRALKFAIAKNNPLVLYVRSGEEAVLDWRLPVIKKNVSTNTQIPVILLAFQNERSEDAPLLRHLEEEYRKIWETLKKAEDLGLCALYIIRNATIEDIFDAFIRFKDQVVIFHYAGHGDGFQLMLESAYGGEKGLVDFLREQEGLKLVFLSGCATPDQTKGIQEYGVPIVIATYSKIQDEMGVRFAEDFYKSLGSGASILEAFRQTEAMMNLMLGKGKSDDLLWEMIIREGVEEVSHWRLPGLTQATEEQEETGFYKLRWNAQNSTWEMDYGAQNGMPATPWNFAIMELEIYHPDQDEPLFGGAVESVSDAVSTIRPGGTLDPSQIYRVKIKEAPPSQIVNIFQKGSEREIQRFEELYQPKASPYLQFVNTEIVADYTLELNEQEWLLFEPNEEARDGQELIFGVEKAVEDWAIDELLENLSKIVRWRQLLEMYSPNTQLESDEVVFSINRLGPNKSVVETFTTSTVEIELIKNSEVYEWVEIQITAQNRGKRNLYLHPIYFSPYFGIQSLEVPELYPGGQEVTVLSEALSIEDSKLKAGTDIFKVIVSDKEIATSSFDQEQIDAGQMIGPTRSLERSQTPRLASWPTNMNWTEQTFTIHLKKKASIEESYAQTTQEPPIEQQQSFESEPQTIRERIGSWREIRQLVGNGETEKALDLALELAEKNNRERLYENIIAMKSSFNKTQREIDQGLITTDEVRTRNSRVVNALLKLTDLEKDE